MGWAYGQVVDRIEIEGVTVFENVHNCPMQVPRHEHEYPYIAVLLKGRYLEPHGGGIPISSHFRQSFTPRMFGIRASSMSRAASSLILSWTHHG
jgi:hypothetical protein